MSHPLEDVINNATHFLLIGDSKGGKFPALSFDAYSKAGKSFYCYDFGGLAQSRGPTKGAKVYTDIADLPAERGDLAIIWVHPHSAVEAVEVAHSAGYTKVWFSFETATEDAAGKARELGMEIVEIGRCPVYYLEDKPPLCAAHTLVTKVSGSYSRPPQVDENAKRREVW